MKRLIELTDEELQQIRDLQELSDKALLDYKKKAQKNLSKQLDRDNFKKAAKRIRGLANVKTLVREETLEELSSDALSRYQNASYQELKAVQKKSVGTDKIAGQAKQRLEKRAKGLAAAAEKQVNKEETELGEGIQIKSSHKGLLHREMGVKQGKKISTSSLESEKKNASPAEKRRIQFALNARKWHHEESSHAGEDLQELSKDTLKGYVSKAAFSLHDSAAKSAMDRVYAGQATNPKTKAKLERFSKKHFDRADKRRRGITTAANKLAEETDINTSTSSTEQYPK